MLYLVGLGLSDEYDLSLKAIETGSPRHAIILYLKVSAFRQELKKLLKPEK